MIPTPPSSTPTVPAVTPTVAPTGLAPSRASSGPRDYTILDGDTFTSIAEEYFSDSNKWILIAKENPTVDPSRLGIGMKIRLPAQDAAMPSSTSASTGASTSGTGSVPVSGANSGGGSSTAGSPSSTGTDPSRYLVKRGDTLASIADQYYGTKAEAAWRRIFEANRGTIGDNPAMLKPGTSLVIPPKS